MKSFKQYITEKGLSATPEEMGDLIINNCEPFLKETNYPKTKMIWRGIPENGLFLQKQVRKDRKPSDMPIILHNMIDDYFEKRFGIRYRSNAMFATSWRDFARDFTRPSGMIYATFPVGQFQYIWSPNIEDLYANLSEMFRSEFSIELAKTRKFEEREGQYYIETVEDEDFFFEKEKIENRIIKFLEEASYQNSDLESAIKSKHEIMIHCDNYYGINEDIWEGTGYDMSMQTLLYDKYVGSQ